MEYEGLKGNVKCMDNHETQEYPDSLSMGSAHLYCFSALGEGVSLESGRSREQTGKGHRRLHFLPLQLHIVNCHGILEQNN